MKLGRVKNRTEEKEEGGKTSNQNPPKQGNIAMFRVRKSLSSQLLLRAR
jgi:hypothetical protein